jgi:hypothetical protein
MIKAPKYTRSEIWQKADEFRKENWGEEIPVKILELIEFNLQMELRPISSMKKNCDTEAALLDLNTIAVDSDSFLNPSFQNRLHFSVAHELGHTVLHLEIIKTTKFDAIQEWLDFYGEIVESEYDMLELQANEFARRLLISKGPIYAAISEWAASTELTIQPQEQICFTFSGSFDRFLKKFSVACFLSSRDS